MKTKNKIVKKVEKLIEVSDEKLEEILKVEERVEEKQVKIYPFTDDFGRADINLLRDKVNEIIYLLNK